MRYSRHSGLALQPDPAPASLGARVAARVGASTVMAGMSLGLALVGPLEAQQQGAAQPAPAAAAPAAPGMARKPEHVFRVCADPSDMPFSNEKREGFENKIAALLAHDLGDTAVAYAWFPTRRGFVRNTLRTGQCDVMVGAPAGYDLVLPTKPYYRSAYVAVTRRDRHLKIASLDDSVLKTLKIGVNLIGDNYENTPPAHALGARGITANVVGFTTFYNEEHPPSEIVDAVANGKIDVAVVWGPLGGYWAKRSPVPLDLSVLPDTDRATGFPLAYEVTLGVRRTDRALRDSLNAALDRRKSDIDAILRDYGVPMLPMSTESAAKPAGQ
jgi:mxaJ protein